MARKVNNQLYRLPDDVTFHRLVSHAHFQELFVSVKPPETRICPKCGSHACVIKSSDRKQTVRHSHVSHSGVLITFKRKRYLCKDCNSSFMQPIRLFKECWCFSNFRW